MKPASDPADSVRGCSAAAGRRTVSVCVFSSVHLVYDVRMFQAEARTLARAGFQVTVMALEDTTASDTDGARIVALPRPRSRAQRMRRTLQLALAAARQRAGIYVFHDPELLPAAVLVKLLTRARLVYDVHEDVPAAIRGRTWLPVAVRWPVAAAYRLLERAALPFIDALTLADEAYARHYAGRRTLTLRNYPLLTHASLYEEFPRRSAEAEDDGGPVLLYAGSITALRGLYEMVQLVARLRPAYPRLRLRLVGPVGEAHEERQARALIAEHALDECVEWAGLVSHRDVHMHALRADVGLALLHPDPNYVDSLPTKMFEYMMMGCPVVVSNFPMWEAIVAEARCGFAVDPLDPDAVDAAVRQLLDDATLRQHLGMNGRRAVLARYSWEREGERMVALYRELADVPEPSVR